MSDVAASGGYYLAMAAGVILAEKLTLTGSIGVVKGDFTALHTPVVYLGRYCYALENLIFKVCRDWRS